MNEGIQLISSNKRLILQDFHGPIVNTDHFLYWGRTRKTVDGKMVEFNIIEQTEFLDDVTFSPFNAR